MILAPLGKSALVGVMILGAPFPAKTLRERQPLALPSGEDATLPIIVLDDLGEPFDLTGGQLLFTVKRNPQGVALISRQALIDAGVGGTATFPLVIADTWPALLGLYEYDVWFTAAGGKRYQVVPASEFFVEEALGTPAQPVTVPPTEDPLAQGPPGPKGDSGIQGIPGPAGAIPSGSDGQFLGHVGGSPQYVTLTEDMIAPAFSVGLSVAAPTTSVVEVGTTVVNPQFSDSHSQAPSVASLQDASDTQAISPATLTALGYGGAASTFPARSYGYPGSINSARSWTYSATSSVSGATKAATTTIAWHARAYYGMAAIPGGGYDEAFALALSSSRVQGGFGGSYAFLAGDGTKFAHVYLPTAWGDPNAFKEHVSQLPISWAKVASNVSVVNGQSVAVLCNVWRAPQANTAAFTYDVT